MEVFVLYEVFENNGIEDGCKQLEQRLQVGLRSQNLTQQALFTCKRRLRQPTYHELFSFASSGAAFVGDVVCDCFDIIPIMRCYFLVSIMLVFRLSSVSGTTKFDHAGGAFKC